MGRFGEIDSNAEYPLKNNLNATTGPDVTDDSNAGYEPGSQWVNITGDMAYVCVSAAVGAAVWKSITPAGGGKSMVLTFASGSTKHVTTNSTTYVSLAHFIYAGSVAVGDITKFNINAWRETGSPTNRIDMRIVDLNTALVVAELTGIDALNDESNVQDMGAIANLPTGTAVFELQGRKTGGTTAYVGSLELEY
jgi:hypothetical protein